MIKKIFITIGAIAGAIVTVWGSWEIWIAVSPWPTRGELSRLESDYYVVAGDFYSSKLRDYRADAAQTRRIIRQCERQGCDPRYRESLEKDLRFYEDEQQRAKTERQRYRAKQRKEN